MKPIVAIILAALALGGGCGGGGGGEALTADEYEAEVAEVGDALAGSFEGVVDEVGALGADGIASVGELDELFAGLADVVQSGVDSLNGAADELAGLAPPEDAEAAHGALVEGLRLLAEDFGTFEQAIRDGEFGQIQELGEAFQDIASSEAGRKIQSAIDELGSLGYDVAGDG